MASRRPRPRRSRSGPSPDRPRPREQRPPTGGPITVATFLDETWLPRERRQVRATTAYRYAWFVENYITPAIGDIPLRRPRVDHLESLYHQLAVSGGRHNDGLAPRRSSMCK